MNVFKYGLLGALSIFSVCVHSQFDYDLYAKSVVLIEVKVPNEDPSMASGFLWEQNDQIVTALHAMSSHPEAEITIRCNGDQATVTKIERVLKRADLVLLKTDTSLDKCIALTEKDTNVPPPDTELIAFGYEPSIPSYDTYELRIKHPNFRPLRDHINRETHAQIRAAQIPDLRLKVYRVRGGIYPGTSGGPVFNKQGKLIGIISGGLNSGVTNKNWLVPSTEIQQLIESSDALPDNIRATTSHFSATYADTQVVGVSMPDRYEIDPNIEMNSANGDFVLGGPPPTENAYSRWVKSKTQSFERLEQTSEAALGLDFVWQSIAPVDVSINDVLLEFDIYEENTLGIVIAMPKNKRFDYGLEMDGFWLRAKHSEDTADVAVLYNLIDVRDDFDRPADPFDENYSRYALTHFLLGAGCEKAVIECNVVSEHLKTLNFGANKIHRMAFFVHNNEAFTTDFYFITFVTKQRQVLVVDTRLTLDEEESIYRCLVEDDLSSCDESYWEKASFLLANAITSISGNDITQSGGKTMYPQVYPFEYECDGSLCNEIIAAPETQSFAVDLGGVYVDEDGIEYFVQDGESWFVNLEDGFYDAQLLRIDSLEDGSQYYILASDDFHFAVPFNNGPSYYQAVDSLEWTFLVSLFKQTFGSSDVSSDDIIAIYMDVDGNDYFALTQAGEWIVNLQGEYLPAVVQGGMSADNGDEFIELTTRDYNFLVPSNDGTYYVDIDGEWQQMTGLLRISLAE